MSLIDQEARQRATDPRASFIVQAPAGSGKTEILTQRYLRLLSTVTAPEQIVALTFTRKAASEMRERIIIALHSAFNQQQARSEHQQKTLQYAQEALVQSERYQWDLLQQTNRLRIITIDSLCQSIAQAIPLLEQQIAYAQITDKAQRYYTQAARQCIRYALETEEYQTAIKTLLLHVDNKIERLSQLFESLLTYREQWITLLYQANNQEKEHFEQALRLIEQEEIKHLRLSLPEALGAELVRLAQHLATVENNPQSPRFILKNWSDFATINQPIATALTHLLLGSDHSFRKRFDHHVGLLKDACSASEYKALKADSEQLLAALSDYPSFLTALLQVSTLPKPEYNPEQWVALQALFKVLPLLLGHLQLLFQEHNEVDFTAIAQQALLALGSEEEPSDLALYFDHRIHHLLVDEFQDTSISQFTLLTRLVQGWQPEDGRTLFIVGDPMQSIYRFRQAEVGLFFRAQEQGIGPVTLDSLALRCNFRSTPTLVNWVNQHFAQLFPAQAAIETGAVSFHAAVPVLAEQNNSAIWAYECTSKEQEAEHLIQLVRQELAVNAEQHLAILVRSRSQLTSIIQLLRAHQIPYQGTDIDLLAHLPHIKDIWTLTQALLMPGNRLAWLALLRSPYVGLSLRDLHCIAQWNSKSSIYTALLHLDQITALSEAGRIRATYLIHIMQTALAERFHYRVSEWVRSTLKKLHVKHLLTQAQLSDLEQFWSLIDQFSAEGRLSNLSEFTQELNKLYSQQASPARLHIMTIHKSKGLEFDTVFLPSLGAQPKRDESPLMRWLKLPSANQDLLLISPIHAAHHSHCPVYDYLTQLEEKKSAYEAQRVLYVAATRAKSRLYLLDSSNKNSKHSFRSMLPQQEFLVLEEQEIDRSSNTLPKSYHLPLTFYQQPISSSFQPNNSDIPQLNATTSRLIGIVTHRLLQWICTHHPKQMEHIPWQLASNELKGLGIAEAPALIALQQQIQRIMADPIGAWIIAPHHAERNEYELLIMHDNTLATRIIDRTFEDQNKLWIIDFKTGKETVAEQIKHQDQLNNYAYYLSEKTHLPIHCGLYYLSNNHWLTWISTPFDIECPTIST